MGHRHEAVEESSVRELFSAILDQSVAGVFLLQDGVVLYVNEAYTRMRGTTAEEMIGKPVGADLEPTHQRELQAMYARRLAGEAPHDRFTITRSLADGTESHTEIHGVQVTYRGRPAIVGVGIDVTEQVRARAALERVQDSERRRIALEIHDELGGILAAARLDISRLQRRLSDTDSELAEASREELLADVSHLREELRHAVDAVRAISEDLRPVALEQLGLFTAVEELAQSFSHRHGIRCAAELPTASSSMGSDAALDLYRIIQESLTNIAKHSGARSVSVRLTRMRALRKDRGIDADHLEVTVEDDGGTSTSCVLPRMWEESTGITGMRERAGRLSGELHLDPSPRGGLRVWLRVPWTFAQ